MTLTDAVLTCFFKSLSFTGRAARAEFLVFLPIGIAFCAAMGTFAVWIKLSFPEIVLAVSSAAVPTLAAWWQHLQGVGTAGVQAILPWVSILLALALGWAATQTGAEISATFAEWKNPAVLLVVPPLALMDDLGDPLGRIVVLLISLALFIAFLMRFSFAMGQALLPSQPGPNRYGPNPNEVPK